MSRLGLFTLLALGLPAVACACDHGEEEGVDRPPAPSASPGIGVPAEAAGWQAIVVDAREESRLGGEDFLNPETYAPKPGFTFLVVDVTLRNLESGREMTFSTSDFTVVSEDGRTFIPVGHRSRDFPLSRYEMGHTTTISNQVSDEVELSLVFVVNEDVIDQVSRLQFLEVPPIPFSVSPSPGSTSTPAPTPIPSATAPMP